MIQQYIHQNGVLYKKNSEDKYMSVCVIPKRIKKLEEAIEYYKAPKVSEGMSIYDGRNY